MGDVLYWVLKRSICYLDIDGANRFEQGRAFKFTTRESAQEWTKKWHASRVVAIVKRPEGAAALKRGVKVTFQLGRGVYKGVVQAFTTKHVHVAGLNGSWAGLQREDILKVHR